MRHVQLSILLLICLTVLFSSCVAAQEKQAGKSFPCKNQAEIEYIRFEKIVGAVESMNVETQTLVSEGHTFFVNEDKPMLFTTYKYDRKGRLAGKNFYNVNGKAFPQNTFDYDLNNKLIKENYFDADQKPYIESKYIYNDDGMFKEITGSKIEKNDVLIKTTFSYDLKRNYFEVTEFNFRLQPEERVGYTQDARCRFSEIFGFTRDGKLAGKSVVSFDDKDNPSLIIYYSNEGIVLGKRKLEYEFDKQGNWIKKSDFALTEKDGKSDWKKMSVVYRKIEYFDTK